MPSIVAEYRKPSLWHSLWHTCRGKESSHVHVGTTTAGRWNQRLSVGERYKYATSQRLIDLGGASLRSLLFYLHTVVITTGTCVTVLMYIPVSLSYVRGPFTQLSQNYLRLLSVAGERGETRGRCGLWLKLFVELYEASISSSCVIALFS